MRRFFILLVATMVGFTTVAEAATGDSAVAVCTCDSNEEVVEQWCGLIDDYIETIKKKRGKRLNRAIEEMVATISKIEDTETYEIILTYLYVALEENIPERGFTMERFDTLYDDIQMWKRGFLALTNESEAEEWLEGYFAFCDSLPQDECNYTIELMARYLDDIDAEY